MNSFPRREALVEQSPRFEPLTIPLATPAGGLESVSAVLGIPEWWPTGSRVGVVIAHGSASDMDDPVIAGLQQHLTERKFLSLRFNFPFGETGRRSGTDSMETMDQVFRAAIAVLGRDPTKAPAHLILGGKGTGAWVAARLATARLPIGGLFFLSYPLHPQDRKEKPQAESLYRITSPMLFMQGTRDRRCDVDTLRQTLQRVGASTTLHVFEQSDQNFKVPKRSGKNAEDVQAEIYATLHTWLATVAGEG
jgi:predicted alpha/beta-hydrolase family hydrolase